MEYTKIMKNIFKVHQLTYVLIVISILSGRFKSIIIFLFIIFFHELGHMLTAKFFNWKIDKIYIYPLGGLTIFNDKVNKPLLEELLVVIMGPIFQLIVTFLFYRFDPNIVLYSNTLLFFNLLPIIPLDGGKILNIILFSFNPLKKSINYMIGISYLTYFMLIIYLFRTNSLFFLVVAILLVFKIQGESRKKEFIYKKYLLEKYLYNIKYKNNTIVNNIKNVYKYRNNYIKKKNRIYSEKDYIDNFFV